MPWQTNKILVIDSSLCLFHIADGEGVVLHGEADVAVGEAHAVDAGGVVLVGGVRVEGEDGAEATSNCVATSAPHRVSAETV